jgi:hypothetical protein
VIIGTSGCRLYLTDRRKRTPNENAAGQPPCPCMIVPWDLSGDDSRERAAAYGTPQARLLGASSTGWSNDRFRYQSTEVSARKELTLPMTNRDGVGFQSDGIPYPRRPRRSALRESGKHGGVDPNFPAHSRRTQRHPIRTTRLRRSQACDPKSENRRNSAISIPPLGIRRGPPNHVSAVQRPSRARGGR